MCPNSSPADGNGGRADAYIGHATVPSTEPIATTPKPEEPNYLPALGILAIIVICFIGYLYRHELISFVHDILAG